MTDPITKDETETVSAATQQFRSQVGHISRQSGIFFAGTIFTTALGYAFKIYLARVLGPEDLGLYALGVTLVGFVGIFNNLGLPQSAVRFVAAYQAAGKFRELHALLWRGAALLLAANVVFAAVILTLGRFLAIRFYHSPRLVHYLPWFAMLVPVGVLSGFYGKVLAGYRDIRLRTLIVNFMGSPLNMLATVLLITLGLGLKGYLLAQILSGIAVGIMLVAAVRRSTPVEARFSAQAGSTPEKAIWSFSAAMLGIGFLEFIIGQVDKITLGHYWSPRDVGIYSVAAALVAYVPIVLYSINQIFAPTIADLNTRGEHALMARLFQSLTKWIIGITLPLAMVLIIFARPLMRLFGHDFEVGWPILIVGTIGQLVNCGVGSVGYLLLMSGNEKRLIKVQIVMAAVMIVCSVALTPVWGILGAAVAAAITNIGTNIGNLLQVRAALGISPYNKGYWRLLPPFVVTLGFTLLLRKYAYIFGHDWLAAGVALAIAYGVFAALILFAGLDDDDRLIAKAIWSRVRGTFTSSEVEA